MGIKCHKLISLINLLINSHQCSEESVPMFHTGFRPWWTIHLPTWFILARRLLEKILRNHPRCLFIDYWVVSECGKRFEHHFVEELRELQIWKASCRWKMWKNWKEITYEENSKLIASFCKHDGLRVCGELTNMLAAGPDPGKYASNWKREDNCDDFLYTIATISSAAKMIASFPFSDFHQCHLYGAPWRSEMKHFTRLGI